MKERCHLLRRNQYSTKPVIRRNESMLEKSSRTGQIEPCRVLKARVQRRLMAETLPVEHRQREYETALVECQGVKRLPAAVKRIPADRINSSVCGTRQPETTSRPRVLMP